MTTDTGTSTTANTITQVVNGYERRVRIAPDRIAFYLVKDNKAMQFVVGTNWSLIPDDRFKPIEAGTETVLRACAWDLGWHTTDKDSGGQDMGTECDVLHLEDGQCCYYDGSTLSADPIFVVLKNEGMDAVWPLLEEYWDYRFDHSEPECPICGGSHTPYCQ